MTAIPTACPWLALPPASSRLSLVKVSTTESREAEHVSLLQTDMNKQKNLFALDHRPVYRHAESMSRFEVSIPLMPVQRQKCCCPFRRWFGALL